MSDATLTVTQSLDTLSITTIAGSSLAGGGTVTGPLNIGVDDAGHDVKFFGDTASRYMLWDSSDDSLELSDNAKIKLGADGDLQLYHDGSQSRISDTGTGRLTIETDGDSIRLTKGTSENMAIFTPDGSVDLYYNNVKKFETTNLGATITGKLAVNGDMDVSGTTTTFNSTVVTVDDPVFTVGGDTAPDASDNKDRGIEFRYFRSGESAKVGFFGYDNSEDAFTFLTDATNNSEVFSGTLGNIKVGSITGSNFYATQIRTENGSASFPSHSFTNDSDSGMYFTSGALSFAVDGSRKGYITNAGIWSDANVYHSPTGSFRAYGYNAVISTNSGYEIVFKPNDTEAARFDSSGRLGVSSTSPEADIHLGDALVNGFTVDRKTLAISDTTNGAQIILRGQSPRIWFDTTSSGSGEFYLDNSNLKFFQGTPITPSSELMRLNSTGLGIGGTPSKKLHVKDGSSGFSGSFNSRTQAIIESDNSAGTALSILNPSSGNGAIYFGDNSEEYSGQISYTHTGDVMKFATGAAVRMNLNSTGLGIGGTPVAKLTIEDGHIRMSDGYKIDWGGTNVRIDGSNADGYFRAFIGSSEAMRLNSTGLGIGGTPSYPLVVKSTSATHQVVAVNRPNSDTAALFLGNNSGLNGIISANNSDLLFGKDFGNTFFEGFRLDTNGNLRVGNGTNIFLWRDNNNNYINYANWVASTGSELSVQNNGSGGIHLKANGANADVVFSAKDGTTLNELMRLDGSASSINVPDGIEMFFGSSSDFSIKHGPNNTHHKNFTGDFYISNDAANKDLIFRASDGTLNELMRLDGSTGNVGIGGVANPDSPLELEVSSEANTQTRLVHFDHNPTSNTGSGYIRLSSGTNSASSLHIEQVSSGGGSLYGSYSDTNFINNGTQTSGPWNNINFVTNEAIRMTIGGGSQAGNVGIGTTSPSVPLTVQGSSGSSSFKTGDGTRFFRVYQDAANISLTADGSVNLDTYVGGAKRFKIDTDGDIEQNYINYTNGSNYEALKISAESDHIKYDTTSIGSFASNTREHRFYVNNSTKFRISSSGVLNYGHYYIVGNYELNNSWNDLVLSTSTQTDNDIIFKPNNTEAVRITDAGNVGIGTTSPVSPLTVESNLNALADVDEPENHHLLLRNPANDTTEGVGMGFLVSGATADVGAALVCKRTGNNAQSELQFWNKQNVTVDGVITQAMTIADSGKVGIGTTSPSAKLEISDSASANIRLSTTDTDIAESQELGALEYYQADGSGTVGAGVKASMRAIADNSTAAQTALTFGTSDSSNNDKLRLKISGDGDITQNYINYTDGSNYEALKISAESDHIRFDTQSIGSFASNERRLEFHTNGTKKGQITNAGVWTLGSFYISGTGSLRNLSNSLQLTTSTQTDNDIVFKPNNTEAVRFGSDGVIDFSFANSTVKLFESANNDVRFGTHTSDAFSLIQNGLRRLLIAATGKVGIASNDPSANADLTLGGGELCMAETTTPTADANFGKVYCKADNKLYFQDGAGTEHEIAFA